MADLTIKINGDLKNYQEALGEAQDKTEALSSQLESLSITAGIAFAAFTAEIYESVKAFAEGQAATNSLSQALQDQGIYSDQLVDKYKKQGEELQKLTGIDNDAITKAQALLQASLGNIEISDDLTKAILDLSAAKHMDLQSTTELIGKGIEGHTMALKKLGIEVDDNVDKQTRIAQIIDSVTLKFGGQAEAATQGLGALQLLHRTFDDVQKALGERFAPAIEFVIKNLTSFFQTVGENKMLLDLIASLVIAGTAVAGVGLAIGTLGLAYTKFQAITEALTVATEAMGLSMKALAGAAGIGLLAIALTELYIHWQTWWPAMQDIFDVFTQNVSALAHGLGKIIMGAIHLNSGEIKEGYDEAKSVITESYGEIKEIVSGGEEEVTQIKKTQNEKRAAHAKAAQELEKTIDEMKLSQSIDLTNAILANDAAFQSLSSKQQAAFLKQNADNLTKSLQTEKTIRNTFALQEVQEDIKRRNQFLMDEVQFGTAYANINRAMHSSVFQGTTNAFSSLSALQQSKNAELKAIGKAAAIGQITIATAKSAMEIYANFQTAIPFPPVSIPLGIAGAAAAIAFGAEQIANVTAAAQGGMITGGIPNVDSVPALLTPGELVVPKNNFEEVVGSVRQTRSEDGSPSTVASEPTRNVNVTIGFDQRMAAQILTILQIEDHALGTSPQGA